MSFLTYLDLVGIYVFAISGGLVAIRHRLDILGVFVVCLLPAIGGGTLRDLLLGIPVFWLQSPMIIFVALAGGLSAIAYKYWTQVKLLVWADAVGLALFAVVGTLKTFELGFGLTICVMMGTITATAGGLLRDVVCNEPPLLLREDIYATAALAGSALCYAMLSHEVDDIWALVAGGTLVFFIRALVLKFGWSLPTPSIIQDTITTRKK